MKLILACVILAAVAGVATGGSLRGLAAVRVRWGWLAFAGMALQLAPWSGEWAYVLLLASFALLLSFVAANLGAPGFPVIALGILANLLVIAANHGMPVTAHALAASGQQATLHDLVAHGGAKHHLAGPGERLLFLGDVIPVGGVVDQVVSVGDILTFAGVGWFVLAGTRRRAEPAAVVPQTT